MILTNIFKLDKASGLALVTWRIVELQKEQANIQLKLATHTPWKDRLETKDTLRGELEQVRRNLSEALAFRTEHYRSAVGSVVLGGSGRTRVQTLAEEIRRFFELSPPFVRSASAVIFATGDLEEAQGRAHQKLQAVVAAYERVRKWLSELELAFFHQLERSLPEGEVAYLRPVLGTDGSHAAHALAKYAVQARGGYRRRMIYGLPKLPSDLAQKLEEAPLAKHIVLDVLSTLLKLDGGSGLALSTLRLAELATDKTRTARAAEQQIDALRRREYPDAFRRVDEATKAYHAAPSGNEKGVREWAYYTLFSAREWLVDQLLRDFFIELEQLVGDERYKRLERGLDRLPIGAASYSLRRRSAGGAEGSYRRARIYGL
ncbi:hypothetical protein OF846_005280 [Rhodotorula toruloides]|nr:hypothetical protein OF846_005280 [Rhodotorula toruloides]